MIMIKEIPEQAENWLEIFFSSPNRLEWQSFLLQEAPSAWIQMVLPWINLISDNPQNYYVILPKFGLNGPTEWFGIALSERSRSQMLEEIKSFLIPSFAYLIYPWDESESLGRFSTFLTHNSELFVVRVKPFKDRFIPKINQQLSLLVDILSRRPAIPNRTRRPFGTIRSDFDRALIIGDGVKASDYLEELCLTGRINAEQRKCLEIRMLAGLGQWKALASNRALISSIIEFSIPVQTLSDVIESLYRTYILEFEREDLETVLAKFKTHILKKFQTLFNERKGIRNPICLRAFFLSELCSEPPEIDRCNSILNAYPTQCDGSDLIQIWNNSLPHQVKKFADVKEDINRNILDEEYETALNLCLEHLNEPWSCKLFLRCAVEIGTADVALQILDILNNSDSKTLLHLDEKDLIRIERLEQIVREETASRIDLDWVSWAKWVNTGKYEKEPLGVLRNALPKWRIEDYCGSNEKCLALSQEIENAPKNAEWVFRQALPFLIEFFVDESATPHAEFSTIYDVMLYLSVSGEAFSTMELELFSVLTEVYLKSGLTTNSYLDLVEYLQEMLSKNNAFAFLNWALSICEILAVYNCPSTERRLNFFVAVLALVKRCAHRITPIQLSILFLLAKDYDCSELLESIEFPELQQGSDDSTLPSFSGLIGIYTLNSSVAQRAKTTLMQYVPNATIELNDDHVATARLTHLAKTADIFVFTYRSAKHPAYYGIKNVRDSKDIVAPSGGGSASLVSLVLDEVKKLKPNSTRGH